MVNTFVGITGLGEETEEIHSIKEKSYHLTKPFQVNLKTQLSG